MALQTRRTGVFRPVGSQSFGDKRRQPRPSTSSLWRRRRRSRPAWRRGARTAIFRGGPTPCAPSRGFSAATICRSCWSICKPEAAAMACIPAASTRTGAASPSSPICSGWPRSAGWTTRRRHAKPGRPAAASPELRVHRHSLRGTLSQSTFFNRQALHLRPDPARVLVRPFKPATEPRDLNPTDKTRANHIVDRVLALDAATRRQPAGRSPGEFPGAPPQSARRTSRRVRTRWRRPSQAHTSFTQDQRRLVGAYFLHEYSFEAAALFNPSIVSHPDQSGAPVGGRRFILSLRAVGEGHVSSLTFRSGMICRRRQRQRRSARASGLHSAGEAACLAAGRGAGRAGFRSRRRTLSERVIFPVLPLAVERHRGCPLRGVRGWRRSGPTTRPIRPTPAAASARSCSKPGIS